jgi:exosortase A-associated hydrolase 2
MAATVRAFILPAAEAQGRARYCVLHIPVGDAPRALVLYLHPFAEEMNKSRHIVAQQSRALAARGFAVLQVDFTGCGDSGGDFGDATWAIWIDDAVDACVWLTGAFGSRNAVPVWLWGLRAGCLLATAALPRMTRVDGLIFWQPVLSGSAVLQQFLRLKSLAQSTGRPNRFSVKALRECLAAGEAVEVAGYTLHPQLAEGLEGAHLQPPGSSLMHTLWFEVSSGESSPAMRGAAHAWASAGHVVQIYVAPDAAFWQTVELQRADRLIDATSLALDQAVGHSVASAEAAPPVVA